MADKKPEYQTHAQITSGRGQAPSAQTPAQPVAPVPSNQSGKVPTSDYLRLLAATGLRVGGPMLGQILGAPIPLPGTAEAGGALGGGLGEYLAEKVEPNNPTHETNKGRIATSAALGAVPGSWIFKAGRPVASAIRGGALSAAGIAGNKLAEGTPITDWSSNDLLNVGVGAGIGGGLGMIGGPKAPPTADPIQSVLDRTTAGPSTSPTTPRLVKSDRTGLVIRDSAPEVPKVADAKFKAVTEAAPKGNPIQDLDAGINQAKDISKANRDVAGSIKKAEVKTETNQTKVGAEQSRAIDKGIKADEAARKLRGSAEDQNIKFDQKAEVADQKAADAQAMQDELDARKEGKEIVKGPVTETVKGKGENGESTSSRTIYRDPVDEEGNPLNDPEGNPIERPTPPAPHKQNYFTKGDALKAAKKANEAAVARGEAMPYDPKQWNVVEIPGGGARIASKGEGRSNASPALTKALEAEEGGAPTPVNPVAQSPDALYKTVHPDDFKANGIPPEGVATPPANPNAAAIAELEQETKTNPLPGGTGPVPATEPLPPAPGPISREQFGAINGEPPIQAPLPLEAPPAPVAQKPPVEPIAPPVAPPVESPVLQAATPPPQTSAPPVPSVGGEGQPIIPFRSQKEAAGSGFGSILDARRAGEVVPDDAIGTASKAFNRIKTESPITAEDAASILSDKRRSGTWDAAIRRGLASGDLPTAPKMDAIRPDITGPEGEMGPEIPIEPKEDGGTTLSAFGGGQGSNIRDAIRNNPMLAARLGLGAAGAGLGSMTTPDDPLKGAIVGGGIGAALPSAGKAIGNVDWSGLAKKAPDLMRFGYLADKRGLPANLIGAPIGLGVTTGIEKFLEGLAAGNSEMRGQALQILKNLPKLPSKWNSAMAEAGQKLAESAENIGDMQYTPSNSGFWRSGLKDKANRIISYPSQGITAAHIALRDIMMDAGVPKDLATEYTLGNDPGIGSGNKAIRIMGKGEQNAKATEIESAPGQKNILKSMTEPFTRTGFNVAAATPTRIPGIGLLMKAANLTEESWPAIVAQQGLGTALTGAAYTAGYNTDPANARLVRKWVRNLGGRYGVITSAAFEAGQAAQLGKSKSFAVAKGAIDGLPMPTTEPFQDITNALTSVAGGTPQLPGSFVPGAVKEVIPKEYMTKRTR